MRVQRQPYRAIASIYLAGLLIGTALARMHVHVSVYMQTTSP